VDDGSPDGCPVICDEYATKDGRVRVIHKNNGGLSDARNAGMAIAQGSYLNFVDSDDIIPVYALEKLLTLALREEADIVIGNHIRFEDILPDTEAFSDDYRLMSRTEAMKDFFQNGCASWARLYRQEIHEGLLFPVGEINEDEAIVLHLLDRCNRIIKTEHFVYFYRCRLESITTASFSPKKLIWVKHCRDNLAFIQEKYPQLEEYALQRYRGSLLWSLCEIAMQNVGYELEWNKLKTDLTASFVTLWKAGNIRDKLLLVLFAGCPRPVCRLLIGKWRSR
jgi:glycosyltransferase involved in cell wall biosynthesis